MARRKKRGGAAAAGPARSQQPAAAAATAEAPAPAKEPVLRPPNLRVVFAAMALFLAPFSYLAFVHYPLAADLRRSILICGATSFAGLLVVLRLIPVAARYLLKRQMFGKDINKKGLPTGEIKV